MTIRSGLASSWLVQMSSFPPNASLALSPVLHELATNAAKYSALRHDDGKVVVRWESGGRVTMLRAEHDGPPVQPPKGEGFGSVLIKRAFPQEYEPKTSFAFEPDGLEFTLSFKTPEPEDTSV